VGLKHLRIQTETVETAGGEFAVRGLSLPDIAEIFEAERAPLSKLFGEIAVDGAGGVLLDDMAGLAVKLASVAPSVVARIIASAADEEDETIALELPFPVQIDALEKIGRLTFATEGAAKKVMETIIRMVKGANAAIKSRQP
jgi:hypothetical protein